MQNKQESKAYANMARDVASQNSREAQILALEKEFGLVDEKGNDIVKTDTPQPDPEIADVEKYLGIYEEQKKVPQGTDKALFDKENLFGQALGGLAEAAQNTVNFGIEVADTITNKIGAEKLIDEKSRLSFADEYFPKSEKFAGQAVRATTQFLSLFIPGTQAAGVAKVAGLARAGRAAATGFASDTLAFKGNEGRLSDILKDTPFGDLAIPYLVTDKNDSELEGRLKNAIEGLGLGVLGDAAFKGIKQIKNMRKTRKALAKVKEIETGAPKSTPQAAPKAQVVDEVVPPQAADQTQTIPVEPQEAINPLQKVNPEFFEKVEMSPEEVLAGGLKPEDLEKSGGYKLNLNRIDSEDQVLNAIKNVAEKDKESLLKRTRGVVPNAQLESLAKETGVSIDELMQRQVGSTFSAEELLVARQFHTAAANDLAAKAKVAVDGDPKSLAEFYEAFNSFKAVNSLVTGAKAEAGRALQSLSVKVSGSADPEILKDFLELANEKDLKQMALAISELPANKIAEVVQKSKHKRVVEAALEVYRNNLLANPKTHLVNFVSNATTFAQTVAERGLAARIKSTGSIVDAAGLKTAMEQRSKLLKLDKSQMSYAQLGKHESELARLNKVISQSTTSSVEPGEATQMMLGAFNGILDGIRALHKSGLSGLEETLTKQVKTTAEKFESGSRGYDPAISAEKLKDIPGLGGASTGKAVDMLGGIQRIPGKGLAWADDFWKFVSYRAEVNAQAHRMVKKLGLEGMEARKYMKEFLENPPDFVDEIANKNAAINTFTSDPEGFARSLENVVNTDIIGAPYLRFAIPFIRAPLNIATFGLERTPLAPMLDTYKNAIAKGGADAQLAKARVRLGSTMIASFGIMSMQGMITGGGPRDVRARMQLEQTGWRPYSLKIDDGETVKYVPLNKLEPIGTMLGLAADLAEVVGEQTDEDGPDLEQFATSMVIALSNLMTPEMLVDSVGTLTDILNGDEKTISKFAANLGSKSVPLIGFSNVARQAMDENARVAETTDMEGTYSVLQDMMSKIKNQVPGFSSTLPVKKNIFGEPMPVIPGFGSILNPFASSETKKNDVVMNELIKLGYSPTFYTGDDLPEGETHLRIDYPPKTIRMGNAMVNLTTEQHQKFVELAAGVGLKRQFQPYPGKTMKQALETIVKGNYAILGSAAKTDQNKRTVIKNIVNAYRKSAQAQMLQEFGDLKERLNKSREGYVKARTSAPDIRGVE